MVERETLGDEAAVGMAEQQHARHVQVRDQAIQHLGVARDGIALGMAGQAVRLTRADGGDIDHGQPVFEFGRA